MKKGEKVEVIGYGREGITTVVSSNQATLKLLDYLRIKFRYRNVP
jgi:hypothetical protein